MQKWHKPMAVGVALCLCYVSSIESLRAATPFAPSSMKEKVGDFGVGARVRLELAGGEKLQGSITAIDEQGFLVSERDNAPRRVAYDQVAQLGLADRAYRTKGEIDPVAARRVVLNLGVGRHAVVKFAGREVHGHIQAVGQDEFTLLPDHETGPVQIQYSQVRYVEKNLSFGATIVLVVLIVAAVAVIGAVAGTR
jgi:ribosome maturation factor RimP